MVTAFLRHHHRILIVRRSNKVGTYHGRWSAISGYLETIPLEQALTEIREETGLTQAEIQLVQAGDIIEADDHSLGIHWIIHPFLFDVEDPDHIQLDWENIAYRWVEPMELKSYTTVPSLEKALMACLD